MNPVTQYRDARWGLWIDHFWGCTKDPWERRTKGAIWGWGFPRAKKTGSQGSLLWAQCVTTWPKISLNSSWPVAQQSDYTSLCTSKPATSGQRLVTVNSWTKVCCLMNFWGLETLLHTCPETCRSKSPSWLLPHAPLESHVERGKSRWLAKSLLR